MIVAADHPPRGFLGPATRPLAMADRADLLDRLCLALSRPGVNGVLGAPDIVEDLLLLGALEGKVVFGSMNRGGLAGATWELDDRFTAYDAASIERMGYEGGKMLTRIDLEDPRHGRHRRGLRPRRQRARRPPPGRDDRAVHEHPQGRPRRQRADHRGAIKASAIAAGSARPRPTRG